MAKRAPLVAVVVGTRPEVVKTFPVVEALRATDGVAVAVWATGQHGDLARPFLERFRMEPDRQFELGDGVLDGGRGHGDATPAAFVARALAALEAAFVEERPAAVVGQGDTSTVVAAALAAAWARIPFVHVEAGLRSGDQSAPWPEELHRELVARIAAVHCAPTEWARDALLREGIPSHRIQVTGNPVVDAVRRIATSSDDRQGGSRRVVVTCHRRENHGAGIETVCRAVRRLAERTDVEILWPVHPNPAVSEVVRAACSGIDRVQLVEPLGYERMIDAVATACCVLTDSGGLQEEAPALGVPVLVLRDVTERPEGLDAGCARLVGASDEGRIVAAVEELLDDPAARDRMVVGGCPYGDGRSGPRIARLVTALVAKSAGS